MKLCPIAIIILTLNEELSLPYALNSLKNWADQVFIVDSFSTDRTIEIAKSYEAEVYLNPFQSYTEQRNWALKNLPIRNDWILFLDADEYLSDEIKEEISNVLEIVPEGVSGFYTKMRFEFLGRWLKHGDIYKSLIRMQKKGKSLYIKTSGCREKVIIDGKVEHLHSYIIHDDKKSLIEWLKEQGNRILLDANERIKNPNREQSHSLGIASLTMEDKRSYWLRNKLLLKLPGPVIPFAQFIYRYLFRFGFLDGWPGFVYHFLLQFWYPLMVEALSTELRLRKKI